MTIDESLSVRVEITYGPIQWAAVIDADGTHILHDEIGQHRFFVESVDADGNRMGWWDGLDYGEAILNAEELSADGFGPVHDLVVDGGAQ